MKSVLFSFSMLIAAPGVHSAALLRSTSCAAEESATRAMLQNKLAGICIDMCKEVGAYPEKCTCPKYVDTTDKTPGKMTWDELLKFMGDLSSWGHESLKGWKKQLVAIQRSTTVVKAVEVSKACLAEDAKYRMAVQSKLTGVCIEMCKEVGAYPEGCTCPNYKDTTDKTPNVETWQELLGFMDKVETQGEMALKAWSKQAAR
eukprot:CAMPEP_0197896702 /NCGR_PEP_ID=MMETSP1439-20131203/40559_1 /TAXON_ID=66791 /ORGANISM="Gonyaulax spinifera, Strain CCMP409" /LENGTH=201 /DNA_ID=CAMNT_0043517259 /DNA_START=58 /DNA_END=663 /DNA_ORIENTATION=-